jgi:hypothetical protein
MRSSFILAASAALLLAGYAEGAAAAAPPEVSTGLRPPSEAVAFLEVLASGVQIYECTAKTEQPASYEWVFRAPEADLVDTAGRALGTHYAGPTWKSTDGSSVVGQVKARDPGPDVSAIPWLLLSTKSTAGSGMFSESKHIQRVNTVGGVAPTASCGASNAKELARVPYTATYYFYR